MPSGSWVCKREFYEKRGVLGNWIQGLDLDLAVRFSIYIKEAYFSYNSFLYYRSHEDAGSKIDDPRHIKEFAWHIFKIGSVLNHLDYKTSKKEINEIIYNYIKHYALLHAILPKLIKLFKFKYFNYIYKRFFQFLNNVVNYDDFRKEDIVDKSFLNNNNNNKGVFIPNIATFPLIFYDLKQFIKYSLFKFFKIMNLGN